MPRNLITLFSNSFEKLYSDLMSIWTDVTSWRHDRDGNKREMIVWGIAL